MGESEVREIIFDRDHKSIAISTLASTDAYVIAGDENAQIIKVLVNQCLKHKPKIAYIEDGFQKAIRFQFNENRIDLDFKLVSSLFYPTSISYYAKGIGANCTEFSEENAREILGKLGMPLPCSPIAHAPPGAEIRFLSGRAEQTPGIRVRPSTPPETVTAKKTAR